MYVRSSALLRFITTIRGVFGFLYHFATGGQGSIGLGEGAWLDLVFSLRDLFFTFFFALNQAQTFCFLGFRR